MNKKIRALLAAVKRKVLNAVVFQEDHLTLFRRVLSRGGNASRCANLIFNTGCKAVIWGMNQRHRLRMAKVRLHERLPHPPAQKTGQPEGFASLPACVSSAPMPTRVCAIIAETSIPQCLHYRVNERAAQLRALGWQAVICSWHDAEKALKALQLASCVIVYRTPYINHVPDLYAEMRRLNLPILFDIDDLIFDRERYAAYLPDLNLEPPHVAGLLDLADWYKNSMLASDTLLASTATLARCMDEVINAPVAGSADSSGSRRPCFVVHNTIADDLAALARSIPQKPVRPDVVRLFYGSGSNTHDADFALIAEGVRQAMQKDARLHLHIHGPLTLPANFAGLAARIHAVDLLDKWTYYQVIADYDIALMPLIEQIFNDAKSNIKHQEAAVFGIPSIASPRAEFTDIITPGHDGLLADTPEEWRDHILQLAADPDLRGRMGAAARERVLARYACAVVARNELLPALPALKEKTAPRVLLVNVLFGLSSFGGATIVVEDIARELAAQGLEVVVFSTIAEGSLPVASLVRYGWNGATVIAANMPTSGSSYECEKFDDLFQEAFDAVQPDIVHFHCIQGMGVGLPRLCAERSIPYVVTVHDAWWLCPRQFMLDPANTYCAQTEIIPDECKRRCAITDKHLHHRRTLMRPALEQAAAVLTPSDFYSDFVRRNVPGQKHVMTNRNGIRPPQALPARQPGPLRFGFLGGKTHHKGYFFMAEAFRSLGRDDFEVVMVDVHTAFGQGAMTGKDARLWQGVRTRVLPFVGPDRIDGLYAMFDVLLFPSLWDESFGLTVREAVLRNKFVIASHCGGPQEALRHGENALLFPKGDQAAFATCLQSVLDDQERYTTYITSQFGDIIPANDQAGELARLYGRILFSGTLPPDA